MNDEPDRVLGLIQKNIRAARERGMEAKYVYVDSRLFQRAGADIIAGCRLRTSDKVPLGKMYIAPEPISDLEADEAPEPPPPPAHLRVVESVDDETKRQLLDGVWDEVARGKPLDGA